MSFKKAVVFSPHESQFWVNLGSAYGSAGNYENSVFFLKKGLNIHPDSIQIRKNLAITYINMEDFKNAIVTLETIPPQERKKDVKVNVLLKKAKEKFQITQY